MTGVNDNSTVQVVVDELGPSDLSRIAADYDVETQNANYAAGNFLAQFVFDPGTHLSVLDDPARVSAANPATYVSSESPPFLLLHGSADQLVSPSQTLILHDALRANGADSTRYVLWGANHGDVAFLGDTKVGLPWSTQRVMGEITTFLAKQLG